MVHQVTICDIAVKRYMREDNIGRGYCHQGEEEGDRLHVSCVY